MIRGITFAEQVFYSADFAHYMNFFLNGGCGITKGCNITQDGTKVTIGKGYFVAHGRLMNVEAAEVVDATKGFASGYNRIIYEIDLSKENTIVDFKQGAIKVIQKEALVQEDLDEGGSVYQFPLCHFQWSGAAISNFVVDAPTLVLDDIFQQWTDNFDVVNNQFNEWFAAQKTSMLAWIDQQKAEFDTYAGQKERELQIVVDEANEMIEELEAGGFEKKSVYTTGTMAAASWNSSAKTYSFEAAYPHTSYDVEIQLNNTCTEEEMEAWGAAMMLGSATTNIITAKGEVPAINLPIIIKAVMK